MKVSNNYFWTALLSMAFIWGIYISDKRVDIIHLPDIELGPAKADAAGAVTVCDPTARAGDTDKCVSISGGIMATSATLSGSGLTIQAGTTTSIVPTTATPSVGVLGDALSVANHSTTPMYVQPTTSTATIGSMTCLNCSTLTGTISVQPATGLTWPTHDTNVNHVILDAGSAVAGHVIIDSGSTTAVTGNVTVVQGTGTNLRTVLDSGTLSTITNALPTGSNTIGVVNQGTANSAANAWPTIITDGSGHVTSTTYPLPVLQGQTTATSDSMKVYVADGTGTAITSSINGTRQALDVACPTCSVASSVGLNTGVNVIGAVTQAGAFTVDVVKIAGTATATGNGVTGAGSQRVTIASDNTAYSVNATLQTGANVVGAVTQSGNFTTMPKQSSTAPTEGVVGFNTSSVAVLTLPAGLFNAFVMSDALNPTTSTVYVCVGNASCTSANAGESLVPGQRAWFPYIMSQTVYAVSSTGQQTVRTRIYKL